MASVSSDPRVSAESLRRIAGRLSDLGLDLGAPGAARTAPRGGSNLTCFVRFGEDELVVRMPPGASTGASRDLLREARVVRRLRHSAVPVPEVIDACDDPSVVGTEFVLSRRAPGVPLLPETVLSAQEVAAAQRSLLQTLATLHQIDPAVAFDRARSPVSYLSRQLEIWNGQLDRLDDDSLHGVGSWLRRRMPAPERPSIVHGDYGTHNVLFSKGATREVTAVLDWELATVGDPHADLSWFLVHARWSDSALPNEANHLDARKGRLSTGELLEAYETGGGVRIAEQHVAFYEVLAHWRMAVILHGLSRNSEAAGDEETAAHHRARAASEGQLAWDVIEDGGTGALSV